MSKKKIVITGYSGFLGLEILKNLNSGDFEVVFLGRSRPSFDFETSSNIQINRWIFCDITNPEIVVDEADKEALLNCDYVLHCAAFYDLEGTYNQCFMANVVGTSNLLNFFSQSKCLKEFHYISTIAVIDPLSNETVFEDELPERNNFEDYYSQTKYIAEKNVREFKFNNSAKKIIYRPGVIVASSTDAKNFKVDGPYYFAKSLKSIRLFLNKLPFVILNFKANAYLPIVPVDHVAQFIVNSLAGQIPDRKNTTYHLVSNDIPTISDLLSQIFFELSIDTQLKNYDLPYLNKLLLTNLGIPKETLPFMFHCHPYDKSNTYRDFKNGFNSHYSDFKNTFMKSLKNV